MPDEKFERLNDALLPSDPIKLGYWENILGIGLESGEEAKNHVLGYKICQVGIYKANQHPQHEYVVAEVESPTKKKLLYRVERSVGRKEPRTEDTRPLSCESGGDKPLFNMHSSKMSFKIFSTPLSRDTVKIQDRLPKDHCTKVVDFRQTSLQPTLLDLAILGSTLHEDSPHYKLLQRQCYWFAGMLVMILHIVFGGTITIDEEACSRCSGCDLVTNESGSEAPEGEMEEQIQPYEEEDIEELGDHKKLAGGTYLGILISRPSSRNAARIHSVYTLRKHRFLEKVKSSAFPV